MDRFAHSFLLTHSRPGMDGCFLKTRRCLLKLTVKVWVKQQTHWRKDVIYSLYLYKAISSILALHGDNDNQNLLKIGYTRPTLFGKCSCMAYGLHQATGDLSARQSTGSVTD